MTARTPSVPPPPAPWFKCSLSSSNACFEVPANTPGAFASPDACAAACPLPLCQLGGTWWGVPNSTGKFVRIAQTPVNSTTAEVAISSPFWATNTTGFTRAGLVVVGPGGFCGERECTGAISQLQPGGGLCAKVTWSNGVWCNPAIDARCGAR